MSTNTPDIQIPASFAEAGSASVSGEREAFHGVTRKGAGRVNAKTATAAGLVVAGAVGFLYVAPGNQPTAAAIVVLNPLQIQVLKAKSAKLPKVLTVAWAVEAIARLGGYLEHRSKTPIGIQVLWRGWLKLHDLCEGWQLAREA